jgi:hypothetical protein
MRSRGVYCIRSRCVRQASMKASWHGFRANVVSGPRVYSGSPRMYIVNTTSCGVYSTR